MELLERFSINGRGNKRKYYKSNHRFIYNLKEAKNVENIGNKAYNLRFLEKKGFNIPRSYVCSFDAYLEYINGNHDILKELEKELKFYIEDNLHYSIRSSANIEDESSFSFAGQFLSHLNIEGTEAIIHKIKNVWDSSKDQKPLTYNSNLRESKEKVKMAVIIQEMIEPKISGVLFTRNPINGLNEIIIESIHGLGDKIVQDGVNPDRWVNKWGEWIETPYDNPNELEIMETLLKQAKKLEKLYGRPLDLEWVYDGKEIYWLQLRGITTLKDSNIFSNKISKEFLPGMIKPLVWSINIPVVNSSWKRIFIQLLGNKAQEIDVNSLAHSFYYRAYFNMGIIGDLFELLGMPRDSLEILAGIHDDISSKPKFKPTIKTFRFLPRMIVFAIKMITFKKEIERFIPAQYKAYMEIAKLKISKMDLETSIYYIEKLIKLNKKGSYFVILTQLLNSLFNMLFRKNLEKRDIPMDSIDFNLLSDRLQFINPNKYLSKLHSEYKEFKLNKKIKDEDLSFKILNTEFSSQKLYKELCRFLEKFGFFRDSGNDFSQPSWSEMPNVILDMVKNFNPSKNELEISLESLEKIPLFKRAKEYQEFREIVIFIYNYGYNLFRKFFLQIGDIFVSKNYINVADDIFYLTHKEIVNIAKNPNEGLTINQYVVKRKKEMEKYKNIKLPNIIYDENPPEPLKEYALQKVMRGVPTSKGHYIGPARIIQGLEEFKKLRDGDVLIIPYSDVSWTPLFSKAKAVISESGGILSHCSIVAREYKIPAIVSVDNITDIDDGILISVNGYNGEVSILEK